MFSLPTGANQDVIIDVTQIVQDAVQRRSGWVKMILMRAVEYVKVGGVEATCQFDTTAWTNEPASSAGSSRSGGAAPFLFVTSASMSDAKIGATPADYRLNTVVTTSGGSGDDRDGPGGAPVGQVSGAYSVQVDRNDAGGYSPGETTLTETDRGATVISGTHGDISEDGTTVNTTGRSGKLRARQTETARGETVINDDD